MNREASRKIIEYLMQIPKPTKKDVNIVKLKVAGKQGLTCVVPNSEN